MMSSSEHNQMQRKSSNSTSQFRPPVSTTHSQQNRTSDPGWPELPEGWQVPEPHQYWETHRKTHFTEDQKKTAWDKVSKAVKTYSDETVDRWTREMDTLLVYAGLFSAVLTAFNVQSYAMLTPPGPDPVLDALHRISEQLSSFSVDPSFVNSTIPAWQNNVEPTPSVPAERWAVWLNALWFSSLICSLSSASVAIMVKQWLNEYNVGISGNSRQTARLRQYRLNALIRWRVGIIISILPTLLQLSLGLFLAGLLVLLWNLNGQVACAASALIGILSLFTVITTILPVVQSDCSYQTPLSLSVFYITSPLRSLRYKAYEAALKLWSRARSGSSGEAVTEWLRDFLRTRKPLCTLPATEKSRVQEHSDALDANILSMAYTSTMDLNYLTHATACFTDLGPENIYGVFAQIDAENKQHGRPAKAAFHWTLKLPLDMTLDVILARLCSAPTDSTALLPYIREYWYSNPHVRGRDHWSHMLWSFSLILQHDGNTNVMDETFKERVEQYIGLIVHTVHNERDIEALAEPRSVAAFAYSALIWTHRERSRHEFWFGAYTKCLYILLACLTSTTTKAQEHTAHAFGHVVKAAQSRIVDVIRAPPDSRGRNYVLQDIRASRLEDVSGVSDDILDAMVDYVTSNSLESVELVSDSAWVMDLKKQRDGTRKCMALSATVPTLYTPVASNTNNVPNSDSQCVPTKFDRTSPLALRTIATTERAAT